MVAIKMSLKELLEHMKDLSDNGMAKTDIFDQAHNHYITAVQYRDDVIEINSGIEYLKKNEGLIGFLNTSNMIEELEEKLG